MELLERLKLLSNILFDQYNSIMSIEFDIYQLSKMYWLRITNKKTTFKIELNMLDTIDINRILSMYEKSIIQEVIKCKY